MPSFKTVLSASAIAFLSAANAHMTLLQPPPYGSPDSSPLLAAGTNFPCKSTSNSGGPVTNMAIGSQQKLTFKGSAVHGGGSCQVALTTDNPATASSKWMVIHSIVGGCPARGVAGNNPENAAATDPDTYAYTIPQGITPGTYTLAWTWFNKVGNREMYMNCANVKVTGGSSKRETYMNGTEEFGLPELHGRATPTFPDLFKANIPTTDCSTADNMNVLFPNPGQSVESAAANPQDKPVAPIGPKCGSAGAAAPAPASSPSSGSSGSGAPAAGGSSAAPSPAAGGSAPPPAGGAPAPAPAAAAPLPDSQTAATAPAAPSPAAPVAAPPAPAAAAPPAGPASAAPGPAPGNSSGGSSSGSSSGSAAPSTGSASGTCTQPGQSICSPDGRQIGTCTMQNTVTWIPVAGGTKCSGGFMVTSKRSAKFADEYVRRAFAELF